MGGLSGGWEVGAHLLRPAALPFRDDDGSAFGGELEAVAGLRAADVVGERHALEFVVPEVDAAGGLVDGVDRVGLRVEPRSAREDGGEAFDDELLTWAGEEDLTPEVVLHHGVDEVVDVRPGGEAGCLLRGGLRDVGGGGFVSDGGDRIVVFFDDHMPILPGWSTDCTE